MTLIERLERLEKQLLKPRRFRETIEHNKELLDKHVTGTYKVNSDGTIDVSGSVKLLMLDLGSILKVGKFNTVSGDFDCRSNKLETLEGAPKSTGGFFSCSNNNLTTLKFAPETVGANFDCSKNKLTSIEGCPKSVGNTFTITGQKSTRQFKVKDVLSLCKVDKAKVFTD